MWRDRRNCEALKVTPDALKILKKFPAKRMDCPYCEKSVYALPSNLTEDGKMLDWCCQKCGEPIETRPFGERGDGERLPSEGSR